MHIDCNLGGLVEAYNSKEAILAVVVSNMLRRTLTNNRAIMVKLSSFVLTKAIYATDAACFHNYKIIPVKSIKT